MRLTSNPVSNPAVVDFGFSVTISFKCSRHITFNCNHLFFINLSKISMFIINFQFYRLHPIKGRSPTAMTR